MGEQPVFTCQAHVFTINPSTRRSWVQASSKAIDINIFYDSTKQCYRIVSVEDGPTGIKVVINSTITSKMVFKQTSQKFGQWADPKSSGVFGLGFDSEVDLNKFVTQFRQCVEATKQTSGESNVQNAPKQAESQPSTLKNGQTVASGALMTGDRSTLPLMAPQNPPLMNTFRTTTDNNGAISAISMSTAASTDSEGSQQQQQQLMHQQYYQEHIQRLERELEAVRRQVSKNADSASPNSPMKGTFDGAGDIRDGFERVHLTSSDSGGSGSITGNKESSSLVHKVPLPFLVGNTGTSMLPGLIDQMLPSEQLMGNDGASPLSENTSVLLKLHSRLGRILQEACDLHKQIGQLLTTNAAGQPS
ncbi:hypothetical protein Aperf_G00000069129 [Anoplocephala perfoliata]